MKALIMAGGIGARFWPKSRTQSPKHLLSIINEKTMLDNTIIRLDELVKRSDCFIVTNQEQKVQILNHMPDFRGNNIIAEPFGRNTAAAIGYGAVRLSLINENETMIVLPADHYIRNTDKFIEILKKGVEITENDPEALVTIGIQPTYPETGYGYIQVGQKKDEEVYQVNCFAEKPNFNTAVRFLESGDFFWNSGIFIWKAKTILARIKQYLPEMYDGLMQIKASMAEEFSQAVLERVYKEFKSISIDYGIMEKAENVQVVIGDFGWSDVGSWQEIYRLKEKNSYNNVVEANLVAIDTEGCYFSAVNKDKIIATVGLKNMAIVDTDDALLITPLDRSQDVKEIVEKLKNKKMNSVL